MTQQPLVTPLASGDHRVQPPLTHTNFDGATVAVGFDYAQPLFTARLLPREYQPSPGNLLPARCGRLLRHRKRRRLVPGLEGMKPMTELHLRIVTAEQVTAAEGAAHPEECPELLAAEARLLNVIRGLSEGTGRANVTNRELAAALGHAGLRSTRVTQLIAGLRTKGYVARFYEPDGTNYLQVLDDEPRLAT